MSGYAICTLYIKYGRRIIIIIIIIIELYLNTVLFHKLLAFNLIMYKREGKEKM